MNILFNIHAYLPTWCAGAEKSFHDLAKGLKARGHDVRVIVPFVKDYEYEGIRIHKENKFDNAPLWRQADLVFTQLNSTGMSRNVCRHYGKPLVHFARNDNNYDMVRYSGPGNYIVYNSEWVARSLAYPIPGYVLPPSVDYRYYDVGGDPFGRKYITLINHNANKGANQVIEIARRMPDREFLFVDGGYGDQITEDLPNLTVWPHQADIREVYKVTRLLLMPSNYESWGRTCTEAMCNGIPVIHSNTPGLMENSAGRQIAVDRDNIAEWMATIAAMDNKKLYSTFSADGRKRARELDPEVHLTKFVQWLEVIAKRKEVAA